MQTSLRHIAVVRAVSNKQLHGSIEHATQGCFSQALVESRSDALDAAAVNAAVSEAAELVSDSDLTVTAQTLQLATAVLRHQPAAGPTVAEKVRLWSHRGGLRWNGCLWTRP